jgi:hypothetical protein
MKQEENPEITEFQTLLTAIQTESNLLKKLFLTKEEREEESKIINEFDTTIQSQVFSTLNNLVMYQLEGWRELVDGGDGSEDGANPA